ncbi:alpha/beta-hydrolase [Auriculariales sp. MPI-PUGE-AT-0066]|nr:alpha/beta-hydrolase [Auriculariales sp. MPI-PUGE-AT-0066]
MRLTGCVFAIALAALQTAHAATPPPLDSGSWNRIVSHWKYATSAYQDKCASPNGKVLLKTFSNNSTGVHGYIVRDDVAREFVVAFRGAPDGTITSTIKTHQTLTTLVAPGVPKWGDLPPRVHAGFLAKYNSVAKTIQDTLKAEVKKNVNDYGLYYVSSTGHNVGGALALINAVVLKYFEVAPQTWQYNQAYTYGIPRIGNDEWSALVSEVAGHYRVVHTNDGVPHMIARKKGSNGWTHPPIEYWTWKDPPSAKTTEVCRLYGDDGYFEDNLCSLNITTNVVNGPHFTYCGISYKTPFCK